MRSVIVVQDGRRISGRYWLPAATQPPTGRHLTAKVDGPVTTAARCGAVVVGRVHLQLEMLTLQHAEDCCGRHDMRQWKPAPTPRRRQRQIL